jgi:bifunctional DNA-binding transcriptional regulator/antitoxin component of YhaV-PrlF toxin-antitoxin module
MPQLAKGGKYAYGWSRVGNNGGIVIPPEALSHYRLQDSERLILLPGSKASGGFTLGSLKRLEGSTLGGLLAGTSDALDQKAPNGHVTGRDGRALPSVQLRDGAVKIPAGSLEKYGIHAGDELLVVRGSALAISFVLTGRIVDEARWHPQLQVFQRQD